MRSPEVTNPGPSASASEGSTAAPRSAAGTSHADRRRASTASAAPPASVRVLPARTGHARALGGSHAATSEACGYQGHRNASHWGSISAAAACRRASRAASTHGGRPVRPAASACAASHSTVTAR